MGTEVRTRLIRVALGDEPAETVLRGARIVNVFTREIVSGDVVMAAGRIAAVGDSGEQLIGPDTEVIDAGGRFVAPGLIDPHMHLESSNITVTELARAIVPRGVLSVCEDPHEIANVLGTAGVDLLTAEAAGLPLAKLWGHYVDRIPAYASIVAAKSPAERADDALALLERGYRAIKLRAHAPSISEDVEMVEKVRAAVGDRMEIMVDANQAGAASGPIKHPGDPIVWDYERALATARAYEQLGVYWLEEPLPRYDLQAIARLTDAVELKIAGGEGNAGLHEFYWMLDAGAYDIIQPDAATCEGVWQLRKLAAACERAGKLFIPHHGANGIALAAHLHLQASVPNSPWVEYIIDPPWRTIESYQQMFGVMREPLLTDSDGCVPVPQGPGLGIAVDESVVARFAV